MTNTVAIDDTATTDGELPRQAEPVVGINIEQLDISTRQAAAYLFPRQRGLLLLKLLFLQAEIKTLEIDGSGPVKVAIIYLQSIEVFALRHSGWSKDTTLRYLAILEKLQILQRYRHADHTELHVPLTPWHPSPDALSELDALLVEDAAREKLQQLARGVKARFTLLYGSPSSWLSLFDDLRVTLTDVEELLEKRLSVTKRQLLQQRVANLKSRLETDAKKGDFHCGQCSQNGQTSTQKGDFHTKQGMHNALSDTQKGDFCTDSCLTNEGGDAQKGDFQNGQGNNNGSRLTRKGDFQNGQNDSTGLSSTQKGDFQRDAPIGSAQKGDFQRQSAAEGAQKGDFQRDAPSASLNDNVITIHNDILEEDYVSDNDGGPIVPVQEPYSPTVASKVGRKLAFFLENSPENIGGFVNKCKVCTPTVIQAAVIDVLVHQAFPTVDPADDRGRPLSKAKCFHENCKKYAMPSARIPTYIEKWLRTDLYWQDLDTYWQEIAKHLEEAGTHYRRYMIAGAGSADLVRQWLRGEIEQQVLDEALQSSVLSQEKQFQKAPQLLTAASPATYGKPFVVAQTPAHVEKTWMDEDEAEVLAEEILKDAGPLGVSKAVAKQEHGVYVVTLIWRGSPMSMKTPQQWRTHFAKVRPHFESMQRKEENNGSTK